MIELSIVYSSLFYFFLAFINLIAYTWSKFWLSMFMCGFTFAWGLAVLFIK